MPPCARGSDTLVAVNALPVSRMDPVSCAVSNLDRGGVVVVAAVATPDPTLVAPTNDDADAGDWLGEPAALPAVEGGVSRAASAGMDDRPSTDAAMALCGVRGRREW